jgi:hypothetical protein
MAINDTAKNIMLAFNSEAFIETGLFRGGTPTIIRSWFPNIKIYEIEINPEFYNYGNELFCNDPNTEIILSDSKKYLEHNIEKFKKYSNPLFFLDAHWDPNNWPLREEIKYICELDNPIILIDDFKTPGKPYGYDSYKGKECSKDYISDLIKPFTDYIYFCENANQDGQGCGVIFINRTHNEIKAHMEKLSIFGEKL